jgi:peptide chain release factor 3
VLLFRNEWNCQQIQMDHPELQLNNVAPVVSGQEPESL